MKANKLWYAREDDYKMPSEYMDGLIGNLYLINHPSYSAQEYVHDTDRGDYSSHQDFMEALQRELGKGSVVLPVYMHVHGSVIISLDPFACPWDSSWAGVMTYTPSEVRQAFGWQRISARRRKIAHENALETFSMWKAWIEEDVYRVMLEHMDGEIELMDICYGEIDLNYTLNSISHAYGIKAS